jgi:surfeit locus 1 family protein
VRLGPLEFTPGFWPTAGAALMIGLTVWLGRWQTDRGDEKEALQALLEARERGPAVDLGLTPAPGDDVLFRPVRAKGEFAADAQFFIDNQVYEGRAGFHVITPLRIAGSKQVVLVDRGWIERTAAYPKAPRVDVPGGEVQVTGTAWLPPRRYLELSADTIEGDVWQNLSIDRYRSVAKQPVLSFILLADTVPPGLTAVHERPDTGIERHREYALTWYSLAATTLGLWIALNLRRVR